MTIILILQHEKCRRRVKEGNEISSQYNRTLFHDSNYSLVKIFYRLGGQTRCKCVRKRSERKGRGYSDLEGMASEVGREVRVKKGREG